MKKFFDSHSKLIFMVMACAVVCAAKLFGWEGGSDPLLPLTGIGLMASGANYTKHAAPVPSAFMGAEWGGKVRSMVDTYTFASEAIGTVVNVGIPKAIPAHPVRVQRGPGVCPGVRRPLYPVLQIQGPDRQRRGRV